MKKIILFLSLAVISFAKVYSQCTFAIPSNATIIDSTTTLGMVNGIYWVCSGDTLNGSGVHNTYFVESGGSLDMSGIEKIVYLKSGASINCSGIDDTIYYEPGAIISCSGNHVDKPCGQIIFDYTNAPLGGCVTTGLPNNSNTSENKMTVSPNPFSDETIITFYAEENKHPRILIYDLIGNTVMETLDQRFLKGENKVLLKMPDLKNGMYLIEVKSGQSSARSRLVKKS